MELVPGIVDECSPFEFARSNDLSLSVGGAPPVKSMDGANPMMNAFDEIVSAEFNATCCELLKKINESRCFCQEDVVNALQSDMEEELLAFTIFSAGRPAPRGCGGPIWAAVDNDECVALGPMGDEAPAPKDCRTLSQVLRDPQDVREPIGLFAEAVDATDLTATLEGQDVVTIFAPTDTAFTNFAEAQKITVSELFGNVEALATLLKQHVTDDILLRSTDVDGPVSYESLEGRQLALDTLPAGGVSVEGSPVSQADITICNGVIHVVSAVLVDSFATDSETSNGTRAAPVVTSRTTDKSPSAPTPTTTDEEDEECKEILDLLVSFEEAFGVLIDEIEKVDSVKDILEGDDPVTLFAPINSAVEVERMVNGGTSVEDIEITLKRLIVEGDNPGSALKPGTTLTTIGGEEIEITVDDGTLQVNGVKVVQADVEACNGRIFIIEGPLPPNTSLPKKPAKKPAGKPAVKRAEEPAEEPVEEPIEEPVEEPAEEPAEEPVEIPAVPEATTIAAPEPVTSQPQPPPARPKPPVAKKPVKKKPTAKPPATTRTSVTAGSPCACSATGITAGVETGRPGCGQHVADYGEHTLFCYIEDPEACKGSGEEFEITESAKFPPGYWRTCEEEEVTDLPTLPELLSVQIESLLPVWRLFQNAELDSVLEEAGPFTVFVPSRLALANALSSDASSEDFLNAEDVAEVMKNHIVVGKLYSEDLAGMDSVTAFSGKTFSLQLDEYGGLLIGGAASVELPDLLARNGIAHIIDGVLLNDGSEERTVSMEQACSCSEDEFSGDIYTGRPGCDLHIPGEAAFCYVKFPDECDIATASTAFPGAKWIPCTDPCSCADDGVSGSVVTGRPGCARHLIGEPAFCYVVEPNKCSRATPSLQFDGASWKWCNSSPLLSTLVYGRPGGSQNDPCACSEDGISGGVFTGRAGCGRFGVNIAHLKICYVVDPPLCPISLPSLRAPGAGWRVC